MLYDEEDVRRVEAWKARMAASRSFRCLTCNRVSLIPLEDFRRMPHPWCLWCGSNVRETDVGYKRRTGRSRHEPADKLGCRHLMPHECPWCDDVFRSRVGLNLHIRDHHHEYYEGEIDE